MPKINKNLPIKDIYKSKSTYIGWQNLFIHDKLNKKIKRGTMKIKKLFMLFYSLGF